MNNKADKDIQKILDLINKSTNIVLFPHENPDADCIGSACGLMIYLREVLGKKVKIIEKDYLNSFLKCNIYETDQISATIDDFNPDLYICLDTSNVKALTPKSYEQYIEKANVPVVNIDHHPTNLLFADVNVVNPDASSEGEIIEHILRNFNQNIPAKAAHNLLFGLIFDTQNFKIPSVKYTALESAANLIRQGAELRKIIDVYIDPPTFEESMALKKVLGNLKDSHDQKIIWAIALKEDFKDPNFESYLQKIKSYLAAIKEVEIVAIFKEFEGEVDVSLRSKKVDILNVAKYFNGGGHKNAAGFKSIGSKNVSTFEKEVIHKLEELLEYQK